MPISNGGKRGHGRLATHYDPNASVTSASIIASLHSVQLLVQRDSGQKHYQNQFTDTHFQN